MATLLATPSGVIKVSFAHGLYDRQGRRVTWCNLIDPHTNHILATGTSKCSVLDRFSPRNGRAYAFARALLRALYFKTIDERQVSQLVLSAAMDIFHTEGDMVSAVRLFKRNATTQLGADSAVVAAADMVENGMLQYLDNIKRDKDARRAARRAEGLARKAQLTLGEIIELREQRKNRKA